MCRPFKDFGKGFYLTPDLAVAKRMAERCVERSNWQGAPKYVYVYDFDDADLTALNVRRFAPIVPIADDRMGVLFRRFEDGEVTIEYLVEELKFKKLSMQYSFHTERALLKLTMKEVRHV